MHLVTFLTYIIVFHGFARSNYTVKILQMTISEQITELHHHRPSRRIGLYRRPTSSLSLLPNPPAAGSPYRSTLRRTHPLSPEGRWLGNGTNDRKGVSSDGHNGVVVEALEVLPCCLAPLDDGVRTLSPTVELNTRF